MATKDEVLRLKLDADLLKQLTREPGYRILETQVDGYEADALARLLETGPRPHTDDYYKGFIAGLRLIRGLPDKLTAYAEALKP